MNLRSHTCYTGMHPKRSMVYGFTIQMSVKKLQISLIGVLAIYAVFFSLFIYTQTFSYKMLIHIVSDLGQRHCDY